MWQVRAIRKIPWHCTISYHTRLLRRLSPIFDFNFKLLLFYRFFVYFEQWKFFSGKFLIFDYLLTFPGFMWVASKMLGSTDSLVVYWIQTDNQSIYIIGKQIIFKIVWLQSIKCLIVYLRFTFPPFWSGSTDTVSSSLVPTLCTRSGSRRSEKVGGDIAPGLNKNGLDISQGLHKNRLDIIFMSKQE